MRIRSFYTHLMNKSTQFVVFANPHLVLRKSFCFSPEFNNKSGDDPPSPLNSVMNDDACTQSVQVVSWQLSRAVPNQRFLGDTLEVMPDLRFHLVGPTRVGRSSRGLARSDGVLVSPFVAPRAAVWPCEVFHFR